MTARAAATRYPGYDVLNKRGTPSWDEVTRRVVDERLAVPAEPRFLDQTQWDVMVALCAHIIAQPDDRPAVPLAAMLDAKLVDGTGDGYRHVDMPPLREAWRIGLAALDAESREAQGAGFAQTDEPAQHALISRMQAGELKHVAWQGMPCDRFFTDRVLTDICGAYYAHPSAWSEIGFGGPANPRGYVRMDADRRDAWEAIEAQPGEEEAVRLDNRRVR